MTPDARAGERRTFEDGKYTVCFDKGGVSRTVLRYGEEWRDITGDKFIGALLSHIEQAERELAGVHGQLRTEHILRVSLEGELAAAEQRVARLEAMLRSILPGGDWHGETRAVQYERIRATLTPPAPKKPTHVCTFEFLDDGSVGCARCQEPAPRTHHIDADGGCTDCERKSDPTPPPLDGFTPNLQR